MSRFVDVTVRGTSSMPSGKEQISSKIYFKDWTHIPTDQYKKPKNMQGVDMIHQY
jgi:hypothetical protein